MGTASALYSKEAQHGGRQDRDTVQRHRPLMKDPGTGVRRHPQNDPCKQGQDQQKKLIVFILCIIAVINAGFTACAAERVNMKPRKVPCVHPIGQPHPIGKIQHQKQRNCTGAQKDARQDCAGDPMEQGAAFLPHKQQRKEHQRRKRDRQIIITLCRLDDRQHQRPEERGGEANGKDPEDHSRKGLSSFVHITSSDTAETPLCLDISKDMKLSDDIQ